MIHKILLFSLYVIGFSYLIHAEEDMFGRMLFSEINTWAHYPQYTKFKNIKNSPFELIVMHRSKDGSDAKAYTSTKIKGMKENGKYVLAVLTLDQAQKYNYYWEGDWKKGSPDFLAEKETYKHYRVKYWKNSWWEDIVQVYVQKLLDAGFDGVYLVDIDDYRETTDDLAKRNKRADKMINLIKKISKYGEAKKSTNFIVCAHNGLLIRNDASPEWVAVYDEIVDCYAVQDVFYNYTDSDEYQERWDMLEQLSEAGKKIFSTELIGREYNNEYFNQVTNSGLNLVTFSPSENYESKAYLGTSVPNYSKLFDTASPILQPIGENPEIDENSDAMIQKLKETSNNVLKIDQHLWTIPVHIIDSEFCPLVDVPTTGDSLFESVDPDSNEIAEDIPIPEDAWQDPKDDSHMCLIDQKLRKVYDFSFVEKLGNNQWQASIVDVWDLDSMGYREPFTGNHWWRAGAMGGGLPLITSIVRVEEIQAGEIKHALMFAGPSNRRSIVDDGSYELCAPASRTNGPNFGVEYIPEGARLQLDPNLDLDTLDLTPESKIVAQALQQYGMFSGENSVDFKLFFQNLGPNKGLWNHYSFNLYNIPVKYFRVLKTNIIRRELDI